MVEHVDAVVHAAKNLLARTHCEYRNVSQAVNALVVEGW